MLVGILKERQSGETRVAATPATVTQLRTLGYEVVVDPGAGVASSFPDAAYAEAGATVGNALAGDVVFGGQRAVERAVGRSSVRVPR